jgi:hypothetical protein
MKLKQIYHKKKRLVMALVVVLTIAQVMIILAYPSPEVMILQPNGREYWGGQQTISWSSMDIPHVNIWYSEDNGTSWIKIAQNIDSSGDNPKTWVWDTTLVNDSSRALIMINGLGWGYIDTPGKPTGYGYTELASDMSDSNFVVDNTPPEITDIKAELGYVLAQQYVNISANITDLGDSANGRVHIEYPDDSVANMTMINIPLTEGYYFNSIYPGAGEYRYFIWATDTAGNSAMSTVYSFNVTAIVDTTPPMVQIIKPLRYLYVMDRAIMPTLLRTLIFGGITLQAEVADYESGVDRVLFFVDEQLKNSSSNRPHEWFWDENSFGIYTIKARAYDCAGNSNIDSINLFIVNL